MLRVHRYSRRGLVFIAGLLMFTAPSGPAVAAPSVPPTITSDASNGRSSFTYGDLRDAVVKFEGGYAAYDAAPGRYTDPHGGYATTTNKCAVCHAVHRGEGSYYLMRGETQADACAYCHGGSGHAEKVVYDNPGGLQAEVGHAMGAGPEIPLSAVSVNVQTTAISAVDASGTVTTATVTIRDAGAPNKIFRLTRLHSQSPAGSLRSGYERLGPARLSCLSCHQPHNATFELWRPRRYPANDATLTAGYKLLRASPSGSIYGEDGMAYGEGGPVSVSYTTDGMLGYKQYANFSTTGLVNSENTIRAVEATLTTATTGPGKTIWRSADFSSSEPSEATPASTTAGVDQYALSVWCADCHNLAIGNSRSYASVQTTETVFGSVPDSVNDSAVSTTDTAFVALKRFDFSRDEVAMLKVTSDLNVETSGTAEMAIALGGSQVVSHVTTSTSFVRYTDTFAVGGSGETSLTLYLRGDGDTVSNQTYELTIGTTQTSLQPLFSDLSQRAHETSRTHTVPMAAAGNGPGQCYTCHRAGLTPAPTTSGYDSARAGKCERCHYGTGSFAVDPAREATVGGDWPHSAETSAAYMLGAWTVDSSGSVVATPISSGAADIRAKLCTRCHAPDSRTHLSTPTP